MEANPGLNRLMVNMATTQRDILVETLHQGITEKVWCGDLHYQSHNIF